MLTRRSFSIGAAAAIVVIVVIVVPAVVVPKNKREERSKNALSRIETPAPSVSAAPSVSSVPSATPSVSAFPSLTPSDLPSDVPSLAPSETPSHAPSSSPSDTPSTIPSDQPSSHPTATPSSLPSFSPTASPSSAPTDTPTMNPTPIPPTPPIPSDFDFNLRMHWKREYFWQETYDPFYYCMECTDCSTLTATDTGEGCVDFDGDSSSCSNGDQLWVQRCNGVRGSRGNTVFNAINHPGYDVIKIKGKDLCLTRVRKRYLNLQSCDDNDKYQRWEPITIDQPFDLRAPGREDPDRCVTQNHHPKPKEVFSMQNCENSAYKYDTALWDAVAD